MKLAPRGFIKNKKMTTDIFDNKILCKKCNTVMEHQNISKNGFLLRSVCCPKCGLRILHPKDEHDYNDFVILKKKEFSVKMRFVGNSYAVSIPREIVNFMREQEKIMDDMVRLCLEDLGRVRIEFGNNVPNHVNSSLKSEKLNGLREK